MYVPCTLSTLYIDYLLYSLQQCSKIETNISPILHMKKLRLKENKLLKINLNI